MAVPESIQIKITSTPDVIQEFNSDWSGRKDVQILSVEPDEDAASYQFGLDEAVAVMALVEGAVFLGELAHKLYQYLKKDDKDDKKIIVQTPLGRWEFVSAQELTEKEVADVLAKLAGVTS